MRLETLLGRNSLNSRHLTTSLYDSRSECEHPARRCVDMYKICISFQILGSDYYCVHETSAINVEGNDWCYPCNVLVRYAKFLVFCAHALTSIIMPAHVQGTIRHDNPQTGATESRSRCRRRARYKYIVLPR